MTWVSALDRIIRQLVHTASSEGSRLIKEDALPTLKSLSSALTFIHSFSFSLSFIANCVCCSFISTPASHHNDEVLHLYCRSSTCWLSLWCRCRQGLCRGLRQGRYWRWKCCSRLPFHHRSAHQLSLRLQPPCHCPDQDLRLHRN